MWFQELFNTSFNRPTFIEKVTLKASLSFCLPKYQHMWLCQVKNMMLCSVSAANWDTRAGYMEFIESLHQHLQLRHYCLGRSLREAQLWKSKRNNAIFWNGTCCLFWNMYGLWWNWLISFELLSIWKTKIRKPRVVYTTLSGYTLENLWWKPLLSRSLCWRPKLKRLL